MGNGRHVFSMADNSEMASANAQLGVMLSVHTARLFGILAKWYDRYDGGSVSEVERLRLALEEIVDTSPNWMAPGALDDCIIRMRNIAERALEATPRAGSLQVLWNVVGA